MIKIVELTEVGMYCESCGCYVGLPIGFARKCSRCEQEESEMSIDEPELDIGRDAGLDKI